MSVIGECTVAASALAMPRTLAATPWTTAGREPGDEADRGDPIGRHTYAVRSDESIDPFERSQVFRRDVTRLPPNGAG